MLLHVSGVSLLLLSRVVWAQPHFAHSPVDRYLGFLRVRLLGTVMFAPSHTLIFGGHYPSASEVVYHLTSLQ